MNLKKKIILGIGLLVLVVAIGVPAFLMFRGISQFGAAKDELSMTVNSLRSFYKKNPFPTNENIEEERKQLNSMRKWFEQLVDVLTAGQIERRASTPSRFMTQYNQTRNRIIKASKNTIVSGDNSFGFARYADGSLPVAVDVPRLMQQMTIVERLAMIMLDANVRSINKITREEFDSVSSSAATSSAPASSSRRHSSRRGGSSSSPKNNSTAAKKIRRTDIYEVQSFSLEFSAKENVTLDVLNRLSRDDLFIVVTEVEFIKNAADLKMPELDITKSEVGDVGDDESATVVKKKADSEYPIRQHRRVSGPNIDTPMSIRVNLDVYTFFVHKVNTRPDVTE